MRPGDPPRVFDLGDAPVPKSIEPLVSSTRQQRRLVSASNSLTKNRSDRPYARQSSRRRSSPGTYLRYSANSTLDPRCGLGCRPETVPCIGRRANSGKPASRDRTAGSRKLRVDGPGTLALSLSW